MKQVIILLGPPGSGKGTQANLLAEKLDFYHLETSKLIEKTLKQAKQDDFIEINGQKFYFQDEQKIWDRGDLNSRPFVNHLIKNKINGLVQTNKSIIFSGSPRDVEEAQEIMPILEKLYQKQNIKIFVLDLDVEQSIYRNSHRRICELMRHPILYNEQTKNLKICPLDGSKLIKRKLDKPEIIEKRYKVYKKQTLPVVKYLEKNDFKVLKINADQSVSTLHNRVMEHITTP